MSTKRTQRRGRNAKARSGSKSSKPMTRGRERSSVVIVGLGASAGGLEALEVFLRHVPERSGLAFVVVQHLDPTHKDMLVDLLQRATSMGVRQVEDGLAVEPDHVYVIPPNRDLSILHGVLHLLEPAAARGLRMPIDFFFSSLAADEQRRSIGVVLSGMGSDGTRGLQAIKQHGGATFVQEPASAKFSAMPQSTVDAGAADVVARVEELPAKILARLGLGAGTVRSDLPLTRKAQSAIDKICILLRSHTGHDFSQYKRSTLYRRIERRMGVHQIAAIAGYVAYLQSSPQEAQLLFKELLIGVTSFFRDPETWEQLRAKSIPALLSEHPAPGPLRAWVAGCSTGEEAYSLAIVFKEALSLLPAASVSLQIFATDLDRDSIERARQGLYPHTIANDVSAERLRRFFVKEEGGYRIATEVREMVIFAAQNVVSDPPFTKLDILSCRNLLIYLVPELQKKLIQLFHYSLNPQGILVLGSAESIGTATDLFSPIDGSTRIYRRLATSTPPELVELPIAFPFKPSAVEAPASVQAKVPNLEALTEQLLLQRYSPAAVLTNEQGDILYISGHTGKYLEPAAGKANWNVHAMAREGLQYELANAFHRASREKRRVVRPDLKLESAAAGQLVTLTVEPLQEPTALRGLVMIVFTDVIAPARATPSRKVSRVPAAMVQMERDLRRAHEELRTTREEMQTSQEELRATNEELQSTNEELQSTNEELTTSKEEMQSLNEELHTLNHELQAKVDELSHANDDVRNLLDSTDIATLFLDDALRVRRFTAKMSDIFKLIPSDVNRPITDLASGLIYPNLATDARAVLQTLLPREASVKTLDERWYAVRIMPYRTLDNRISGLVITFVDITAAKLLEATLRQNQTGAPT